ncbi:MAG TPA: FecR domain-containing protein [Ohtaekwangia sp.]|uniref:FecR family protein n=1 Tax=Ohtaekwangia sp. TaxID=2066019 RepID=UPI002F92AF77
MKRENDIEIKDELIVRYLAGEATPEEAMALQDWLVLAENRSYYEKIETAWNSAYPSRTPREVSSQRAWNTLQARLTSVTPMWKEPAPRRTGNMLFRIAASLLITIIAGLLLYIRMHDDKIAEVNVTTKNASQRVGLPDSSVAILYHNSTLLYPPSFGAIERAVRLTEGEAFFKVTPNKEVPFIIHTVAADIRVIGTAFNVVTRKDGVEVSVKEGKVLVYTATDSSYLEAGSTAVIRAAEQGIQVRDSVNANSWGYATRQLVFKDQPMAEVIMDIEKAYPYSIRLLNKNINNCRLTATFDNDSAENLLNLIAETLNLSVAKNGNVFTLEGEGCP